MFLSRALCVMLLQFKVPGASMHEHNGILSIFDHYLANGPIIHLMVMSKVSRRCPSTKKTRNSIKPTPTA